MALLLALARNVPQAHASLTGGAWERSKFSGVELYEKTLGILGFGRIGQLVAQRARGFGMHVIAYDPYVGAERYRELGVEQADVARRRLRGAPTSSPCTCPRRPTPRAGSTPRRSPSARTACGCSTSPAGRWSSTRTSRRRWTPARSAGAALDVFRSEPITDHPLFGYPNVIVTPHLGASTAEATDRAGYQAAEQVVAALTGGVVTSAVNVPAIPAEDLEVLGPVRAAVRVAGPDRGRAGGGRGRLGRADRDRVPRPDRRARHAAALHPGAARRAARATPRRTSTRSTRHVVAEERGIRLVETKHSVARDYTDLVRVQVTAGGRSVRVAGTLIGRRNRPHLLEAWGQRFNVQLEEHVTLFRYRDVPGMLGRVGTLFGEHGVNIVSAAVGRLPEERAGDDGLAAMAITTASPVSARRGGRDRHQRRVRRRSHRRALVPRRVAEHH